jgi:hypothetical protein
MPTHCGSLDVRYLPVAKEDEAHKDHKNVVQEVDSSMFWRIEAGGYHACEF